MGVVYRATDSRFNRDVALKLIPEALGKDPQIMGRFEREAQLATRWFDELERTLGRRARWLG